MRLGLLPLAVLASLLCASAGARADGFELPAKTKRAAVGGELGYFHDRQEASSIDVLSTLLELRYAFSPRWSLSADWGLLSAAQNPEHGSADFAWRPGNPTAYAVMEGAWPAGRGHYRLGVGGSAPLAVVERDGGQGRLQHLAYNDAQGMDGLWHLWLWAPSRGALLGRAELALDLDPELRLDLAFAPALMIPAREAYGHEPVVTFLPFAVGFSTSRGIWRLGVRFQAVVMPANPDVLQTSVVPWIRVALGQAFIEARYTGNIDEPLAGERGPRIWGVQLAAGGVL